MNNTQELPKFTTSYDEEFKDYYHFKNGKVMAMSEVSDELNKQAEEIKRLTQQNSGLNICLSDQMERIAKLEKYNLALANESHAKSERIAELEAYLDNVKTLSIYVAFHDSAQSVSLKQAREWLESFKIEQQAKGIEGFLLDANTDYESLDFKYWSFNNDYTSKYLCDLREQAKQQKGGAE